MVTWISSRGEVASTRVLYVLGEQTHAYDAGGAEGRVSERLRGEEHDQCYSQPHAFVVHARQFRAERMGYESDKKYRLSTHVSR